MLINRLSEKRADAVQCADITRLAISPPGLDSPLSQSCIIINNNNNNMGFSRSETCHRLMVNESVPKI